MMRLIVFVLLISGGVYAQQNDGDLESLLQQIFGSPNSTDGGSGQNGDFAQNGAAGQIGQNSGSSGQVGQNSVSSGQNGQNSGSSTGHISGGATQAPTKPAQIPSDNKVVDLSCTTESGEEGECVQYYLCNNNNSIITDGTGIIDIRARDGPCESYIDTCCLVGNKRPPDNPITPPPPPQDEVRVGCGWRNPKGVGFQIKGDKDSEAAFGEFPWMVAILTVEPVNDNDPDGQKLNVYVGGGALIHARAALSAAHHVARRRALRVRAGEWDTQTRAELYAHQDRAVAHVLVHPDFNAGNLFYDVAVLILAEAVTPAPNVGVACLPPERARAAPGARCFASGWGKDTFGKQGRYQVILKKVEVPVVEHRACEASLRKTRLGRYFMLHSSFMCAGGEAGRDTCKGDGGSPLVCPIEGERDRYVQSGIVAWGIGCGDDGTPGVYVDVAAVRGWVDDAVRGKGLDTRSYTYDI